MRQASWMDPNMKLVEEFESGFAAATPSHPTVLTRYLESGFAAATSSRPAVLTRRSALKKAPRHRTC